ncbi:MAG: peroxiredoxin-like family protein [Gammaproteobacteria bacterium]|nr:peroxiredoxin-like family protein [Gammaproteobacteria bacterium]
MTKLILVLIAICVSNIAYATTSLSEDLDRFVKDFIETAPEDVQSDFNNGVDEVRYSGILDKAINVGDYAPEFNLVNAIGKYVSLYDQLEKGPVVLVWYRGGWCPYCNLQLQHIQKKLNEIHQAGGQVIAISPELPDKTMSTKERHMLEFQVLSDTKNKVADRYKLAYTVPNYVVDHYDLSSKLNAHNGDNENRLPLAVTYVIAKNGVVEYAFLDADYKNRATPEEIITVLKTLNE